MFNYLQATLNISRPSNESAILADNVWMKHILKHVCLTLLSYVTVVTRKPRSAILCGGTTNGWLLIASMS